MIKSYFRIALRHLVNNKVYSLINIAGLGVGMAVALLIGLWLTDELNFNKSFDNYQRIGKLWQFVKFDVEKSSYDVMPAPLAGQLRRDYPGIHSVALVKPVEAVLALGTKKFRETGQYAEPAFSEMMSLKMISGTRKTDSDVNTILLSASLAQRLFGQSDPVNQVIRFRDSSLVKVTGVYADFPKNSSFADLHFVAPWSLAESLESYVRDSRDKWDDNNFNIYVQLNPGADFKSLSAQIKDIRMKKENPPSYKPEFFIHPMSKWHLYGEFKNGVNTGGMITYVWLFGIIGVFVLLLACINFMNLSTARSEKRAKEVGIRKTIGSLRWQITGQFFIESAVFVVLAFVLALGLALLILPFFNEVSGKQMAIAWTNPVFWITAVVFCLFTALTAGSYPALYLSGFEPVRVLKGTFKAGRLAGIPRKILVVLQFTISVSMVIGTVIVLRQIRFIKDRPVGYQRENLLEMSLGNPSIPDHFEAFRSALLASGAATAVAQASISVTDENQGTTDFSWTGKTPDQHPLILVNKTSHDIGETLGWKLKSGRNFSRKFLMDSSALIINERAEKLMGFKGAIGQPVKVHGKTFTVIGVVEDIIRLSPFQTINPSIYILDYKDVNVIDLRLSAVMPAATALAKIKTIAEQFDPSTPFTAHFVDEQYNAKFNDQERIGKLAGFFATLAIFISCLGLFGLASYVAEQRTKEIGIRKTLGASILNLWQLLSLEFLLLVGISLLIAIPVSYGAMKQWLQGYEIRTPMEWWIFFLVAAGALALTLLTVSFQAIKAALMNPVRSLKAD